MRVYVSPAFHEGRPDGYHVYPGRKPKNFTMDGYAPNHYEYEYICNKYGDSLFKGLKRGECKRFVISARMVK